MDIETSMGNVTVEDGGTVTYIDRNGNLVTEAKSRSWASDHSATQEPTPGLTIGGVERFSLQMGGDEEAVFRREGTRLQEQIRLLMDENGKVRKGNEAAAAMLSNQLDDLNSSWEADRLLRQRVAAEKQAQVPGFNVERNKDGDVRVTFHRATPSAQQEFDALSKSVTARIDAELKNRRGY